MPYFMHKLFSQFIDRSQLITFFVSFEKDDQYTYIIHMYTLLYVYNVQTISLFITVGIDDAIIM